MSTSLPPAPPTSTAPPESMPRGGGAGRVLAIIFGLLLLLGGLGGLSWGLASTDTDAVGIDEAVRAVVIEAAGGRVEVRAGETTTVTTTRRWTIGSGPEVSVDVTDGTLQVRSRCPRWGLFGVCRASHVVVVPPGTTVEARSNAGGVSVEGIRGEVVARSSAGGVTVTGAAGPVRAESSAGQVTVEGATDDIEARSSAGGVRVTTTVPPTRIDASSSAGGVTVVVPDEVYRVDASSTAGGVSVDVRTDPDADRHIRARSTAGGVTVQRG